MKHVGRAVVLIACAFVASAAAREPLPVPAPGAQTLQALGTVEYAFTPWDDAEGLVVRQIARARYSIYVQAFVFTSRELARGLVEAQQRGVAVRLLADRDMALKGENSLIPALAAGGVEVALETRYASAHNKVMLIDPELPHSAVITGSYNWTYSAQHRNAENLLVLRDNPPLARAYLANWKRHRAEALPWRERQTR